MCKPSNERSVWESLRNISVWQCLNIASRWLVKHSWNQARKSIHVYWCKGINNAFFILSPSHQRPAFPSFAFGGGSVAYYSSSEEMLIFPMRFLKLKVALKAEVCRSVPIFHTSNLVTERNKIFLYFIEVGVTQNEKSIWKFWFISVHKIVYFT
jgi:hypothetical protein